MKNNFFNQLKNAHEKGVYAKFIQDTAQSELFIAFPALEILSQIPQDPRWHPEGDVWTHTLLVIENLPSNATFALALSALFHDVGKATKTVVHECGRISALGHEYASKKITSKILDSYEVDLKLKTDVLFLVARHMIAHSKDANIKTLRKLVLEADYDLVDQLLQHGVADVKGGCGDLTDCHRLRELFNQLNDDHIN
jgi:hypothetical protein